MQRQVDEILRRVRHIDGAGSGVEFETLQRLRGEHRPRTGNDHAQTIDPGRTAELAHVEIGEQMQGSELTQLGPHR